MEIMRSNKAAIAIAQNMNIDGTYIDIIPKECFVIPVLQEKAQLPGTEIYQPLNDRAYSNKSYKQLSVEMHARLFQAQRNAQAATALLEHERDRTKRYKAMMQGQSRNFTINIAATENNAPVDIARLLNDVRETLPKCFNLCAASHFVEQNFTDLGTSTKFIDYLIFLCNEQSANPAFIKKYWNILDLNFLFMPESDLDLQFTSVLGKISQSDRKVLVKTTFMIAMLVNKFYGDVLSAHTIPGLCLFPNSYPIAPTAMDEVGLTRDKPRPATGRGPFYGYSDFPQNRPQKRYNNSREANPAKRGLYEERQNGQPDQSRRQGQNQGRYQQQEQRRQNKNGY